MILKNGVDKEPKKLKQQKHILTASVKEISQCFCNQSLENYRK